MITFIVNIIVMLLNCVVWYHFGKARGKYEILVKMEQNKRKDN